MAPKDGAADSSYNGPLPPAALRMGGAHFRKDAAFVAAAVKDVRRLQRLAGLTEHSRLLDWGCGAGRLAVGVRAAGLGQVGDYHGVDVQADLIEWASTHLSDSRTHFTHVDLANARYNPSGAPERAIPEESDRIDVFYAYSVFSHLLAEESSDYLKEVARLLDPDGRALITCFVEEGVPDCEENPAGYGPLTWSGPVHCVRFERATFEAMVATAGLAVDRFVYGRETDGQSLYVLRRRT
jgi:SAM-dependent methyltransferase